MSEVAKPLRNESQDAWERLGWIWSALFLISLLISWYLGLRQDDLTGREIALIWTLSLVMLAAHSYIVYYMRRNPTNFRDNQPLMAAYIALLLGATVWLITVESAFYFLLFTAYGQLFSVLRMRYALVAFLFLTIAIMAIQVREEGIALSLRNPIILMYTVGTTGGLVMAFWIYSIIDQSTKRRELISELEATQSNLVEAERREAQLEERQRLAREIHDTLAQGFTSIVMHLEALEQALPAVNETSQKHLNMARETARENLTAARRVVQDLRPELLEREPLPEALQRLVARWSDETNISSRAITSGKIIPLHPEVEVTLLRATQEALSNIRKHASASEANVTLTYFAEQVMLDVADNGVGLQQRQPVNGDDSSGGFGLTAMRERVEQLNGTMSIESSAGEGTTLVVAIPI